MKVKDFFQEFGDIPERRKDMEDFLSWRRDISEAEPYTTSAWMSEHRAMEALGRDNSRVFETDVENVYGFKYKEDGVFVPDGKRDFSGMKYPSLFTESYADIVTEFHTREAVFTMDKDDDGEHPFHPSIVRDYPEMVKMKYGEDILKACLKSYERVQPMSEIFREYPETIYIPYHFGIETTPVNTLEQWLDSESQENQELDPEMDLEGQDIEDISL